MSQSRSFGFDDNAAYTLSSSAVINNDRVENKDLRPDNATFYANYASDADGIWGDGVLTGTLSGGAVVDSGYLKHSNTLGDKVTYDANKNADSPQVGTIRATIQPQYTGAPANAQVVFFASKSGVLVNTVAIVHQTSGNVRLTFFDKNGTNFNQDVGSWSPTAGQDYEIELDYDFNNGIQRLFIDGTLFATTTVVMTRDTNIEDFHFGDGVTAPQTPNFWVKEVVVYNTVQHTTAYTPGDTIPTEIYATTAQKALTKSMLTINKIKDISITATSSAKLIILKNGTRYYHDGTRWVVSDGSYAQSNEVAALSSDELDAFTDEIIDAQFEVLFKSDGVTLEYVDTLTITYDSVIVPIRRTMFFRDGDGRYRDDDTYYTDGTLPRVTVYDSSGSQLEDSSEEGAVKPVRIGEGRYSYTREYILPAQQNGGNKLVWHIHIDGQCLDVEDHVNVETDATGTSGDDLQEFRIGFAFQNPDLESNHHAPGWGKLVTPDELRYTVLFGTKLTSPDASQTYDDAMLQWYIDQAIAAIERDLEFDILPRLVRHQDQLNTVSGEEEERESVVAEAASTGVEIVREPGYSYRPSEASHYLYLKLRRRPLRRLVKAEMVDPIRHTQINLMAWRIEYKSFESRVHFFPNISAVGNFPFIPSKLVTAQYPFHDFPNAYLIDYDTGYETAKSVPKEFRSVIRWLAGIWLMEDFGDGKAPGIASSSANLNSISESFSTTQSATNALYGARITYYKEHLKEWWQRNHDKYSRNILGVL